MRRDLAALATLATAAVLAGCSSTGTPSAAAPGRATGATRAAHVAGPTASPTRGTGPAGSTGTPTTPTGAMSDGPVVAAPGAVTGPAADAPAAAGTRDVSSALGGSAAAGGDVQQVPAQAQPADGTTVWGAGDNCLWTASGGYWYRTGTCRVTDGTYTWFYPLGGTPAADWYTVAYNSDQAVTSGGTMFVFTNKGLSFWSACPQANCPADGSASTVWNGRQWVGYADFVAADAAARQAALQAQQAQQQAQQQGVDTAVQQAPALVQQQGGQSDAALQIQQMMNNANFRINEIWLAPACNSSYNGCA